MKSPNVNETQSVAKVVYAINNASSVVCIFSSRLISTFKRAVEIATKDDIVVRVGSQFVRQFIEKTFFGDLDHLERKCWQNKILHLVAKPEREETSLFCLG